MDGAFFDAFNTTLQDFEAQFSETWILSGVREGESIQTGTEWPAISIQTMDVNHFVTKGGFLVASHVDILIRQDVLDQSGVEIGDFVQARGIDLAVNRIDSDGDAAVTLICAPRGVDIWRK